MTITATPLVNAAIARARDLRTLITGLRAVDPALATQLEAKPLLASKTPWGTLLAAVIAWAAARYGFDLDANDAALLGGLGVLVGSYLMRRLTKRPIAGVVAVPDAAKVEPGA